MGDSMSVCQSIVSDKARNLNVVPLRNHRFSRMRVRIIVRLIILSGFAAPSHFIRADEPTGWLTLGQALALTLQQNPELAAFSWDVRSAEARILQARLR